jgi:hypothetical protein
MEHVSFDPSQPGWKSRDGCERGRQQSQVGLSQPGTAVAIGPSSSIHLTVYPVEIPQAFRLAFCMKGRTRVFSSVLSAQTPREAKHPLIASAGRLRIIAFAQTILLIWSLHKAFNRHIGLTVRSSRILK